jgi:hypothetical protein
MDENVSRWLSKFDSGAAEDLDYSHYHLEEQFSQFGIRQIELDVYYDPDGGLFSKRMGNIVSKDPVRPNSPVNGQKELEGINIEKNVIFYLKHIN